jgi:hypothetical protein
MTRKLNGTYIQFGSITTTQLSSAVTDQIAAGGGPKVTAITYPNSATAAVNTGNESIVLTGTGFESGVQIYINGNAVPSVTRTNANSVSFTTAALSSTTYPVYIVNPDGGTAIVVPGLQVSGKPIWTTTSPLSSWSKTAALSQTFVATSDSSVTYSLESGSSLPGGLSLAANGLLSGTLTSPPASTTTYNFTVVAADAENQKTLSAFSITALNAIVFNISPSVNGASTWDTTANGPLTIDTTGTYTITPQTDMNANVILWGAGGGGCHEDFSHQLKANGGGGGSASGFVKMYANTSYTIRVGAHGRGSISEDPNTYKAEKGGGGATINDGNWGAGSGGAYTGIFAGTETFANSVMIAGGGGGGGLNRNSTNESAGGAGGGTTGESGWRNGSQYPSTTLAGGGGTQSAGGAVSPSTNPSTRVNAGQLQGGQVGASGYPFGADIGGGGGSGYYGGGAGAQLGDIVGGGGGGSGYAHPSLTVGAVLTQGSKWHAASNTHEYYANTVGYGGVGGSSSRPHSASYGGNGRFVLVNAVGL